MAYLTELSLEQEGFRELSDDWNIATQKGQNVLLTELHHINNECLDEHGQQDFTVIFKNLLWFLFW